MTFRNGFLAGVVVATAMKITQFIPQSAVIWLGLALAVVFTLARAFRRKAIINSTVDGSIAGFAWIFALSSVAVSAPVVTVTTTSVTTFTAGT